MISLNPIGHLFTPFETKENMPVQPFSNNAAEGYAEILPEHLAGLQDLELFSHVILIYYFHRQEKISLIVEPFLDDHSHGVFATRAPCRPTPIGMSIVPLLKIEGNKIYLDKLDMLNATPLLDIKPYLPEFDNHPEATSGWLKPSAKNKKVQSDGRFIA